MKIHHYFTLQQKSNFQSWKSMKGFRESLHCFWIGSQMSQSWNLWGEQRAFCHSAHDSLREDSWNNEWHANYACSSSMPASDSSSENVKELQSLSSWKKLTKRKHETVLPRHLSRIYVFVPGVRIHIWTFSICLFFGKVGSTLTFSVIT